VTSARVPLRSAAQLGKLRRFQRISDTDGFIRVAAIDHPENYLALFDSDLTKVTDKEVVLSKLELVAAMSAECTAVLLDPVWSFAQAVLSQAVPADVGIISGLERLAYSPSGFGTETVLREGWTVPVLARLGTDAAKLVLFHRAEMAEISASQHRLVDRLAEECEREQLPLVVEPLWYPMEGESLDDPAVRSSRVDAIIRSARSFAEAGADVMKVEFPGYVDTADGRAKAADDCRRLDDSIDVPWVLLSASATYEQFRTQVAIAAGAGACGFMAGRAIWGDAVGRYDEARRSEGARTAATRLRELHETLIDAGHGWHRPVSPADTVGLVPADWFAG
jgi:tagatose-1,6-bisphosphate aldolase